LNLLKSGEGPASTILEIGSCGVNDNQQHGYWNYAAGRDKAGAVIHGMPQNAILPAAPLLQMV
jgi:hypothetical protein